MKVTAHTSDGAYVEFQTMSDSDALDLIEDFQEGEAPVITLVSDSDEVVTHIARRHIVRIDLEQEEVESDAG